MFDEAVTSLFKTYVGTDNYNAYVDEFNSYILNDLKTSQALALLWKVVKDKDFPSSLKVKFMDNADEIFALNLAQPQEATFTLYSVQITLPPPELQNTRHLILR